MWGGQVRTAGGYRRTQGPGRLHGGWQGEPSRVSSGSVSLPDQVWVWAQAGGLSGEWSACGKGCWIRGVHWG